MLSYDDIFNLYQACRQHPNDKPSRDELTSAFMPYIKRWAKDVLANECERVKRNWQDDIVSAGSLKLVARIDKLVKHSRASGKHLVDSLRLSVKNAMEEALHRRFVVPFVTPETIKNRLDEQMPAYKPWELRKQVDLEPTFQQRSTRLTNRFSHIDPKLFDRDPYKSYRYFVTTTCQEACRISRELGWNFVDLMYEQELSQTEVAELTGIPRTTIGGRLRQLAWRIAGAASLELDELGRQFLTKEWIDAAEKADARQKKKRGSIATALSTKLPEQPVDGSNGNAAVLYRDPDSAPKKIRKNPEIASVKKALAGQRNLRETVWGSENGDSPFQTHDSGPCVGAVVQRGTMQEEFSQELRFDPAENVLAGQRTLRRAPRGNSRRISRHARTRAVAPAADPALSAGWSAPDSPAST
jgi:hypothetical protein